MINGFLKTDITCDSSSPRQSVAVRGVTPVTPVTPVMDVISTNMSQSLKLYIIKIQNCNFSKIPLVLISNSIVLITMSIMDT